MFSWCSHFIAYMSICLISHNKTHARCDKNVWNEKYKKLRNYWSKMKKLAQNKKYQLHPSWAISQEQYSVWSWFLVQLCRIIFIFSKFWIFGLLGGSKGKKWAKMTTNFVLCTLYLRNYTSYNLDLWCTCVKG